MNLVRNHHGNLTYKIIGLAMRVHRNLGPGLLESVYRRCLCHELRLADIPPEQEVYLPIHYNGIDIESGYRADIIVRGEVLLELKAVEHLGPLHEAQLLTYLRISRCRLGLLMNFNALSLAFQRRALGPPCSGVRPGAADGYATIPIAGSASAAR
nr:GxxExxY protein [uncultured Rhodopila sp.]